MGDLLFPILNDIFILVATVGAGFLVAFLKKRLGIEKLKKIQKESELLDEVIKAGVRYAEQRFASGEKLDAASDWIIKVLAQKGITVTREEVEGLIEATLRTFKDEFGENWGKEVK